MPTYIRINRIDQCCIKIIGIGWRNIFFVEYDRTDEHGVIDPTPMDSLINGTLYAELQTYIGEHGLRMEHAIQSVPYWCITDKINGGGAVASMPSIPFMLYDEDTGTYKLDEYPINIESTAAASEAAAKHVDMAFYCEYEGVEELDPYHIGRGTDDNQKAGHYMFEGDVYPYLYGDGYNAFDERGVGFYYGNYNSNSNTNLTYPYMCPILAIQGTKSNAITIGMLGWGFIYPFYKQYDHIDADYYATNSHISGFLIDYGNPDRFLENYLFCDDADSANDFLNNTLFIRFGRWAEDMHPFEGWGDEDENNPSGGDGDGMLPDETVEVTIPSVSAFNKFFTCYKLTKDQLTQLANFCWSTDLWDTMKKFYASPSDAILGLMFVPFSAGTSGSGEIYFGNIPTGVSASIVAAQFQMKDMGSIHIPETTKSYLDYDPYTKYQIYLPFIGIRELSADDIVGNSLGVKYCNDMLSGACVAHITVNGSIRYSFAGTCGIQVPVTSQNLGQSMIAAATSAGSLAAGVVTGGASIAAGGVASAAAGISNSSGMVSGLASTVSALKPSYSHGGNIGSGGAWLGPGKPFLITSYPNICKSSQQLEMEGYPTFRGLSIGSFSGYTQFEAVKLKATKATQEEQEEIIKLLKGGVFV